MNLDELRSVQAKERRKDSLQHLRDTFYEDVAAYIADLRAARDRRAERVENPFSDDDVRRMSDEVETAEEVAEALYERRVGKVVKLASFAAADMPVEREGMTTQERELFEDLVARIEANKSSVLDVLTGSASVTEAASNASEPTDAAAGPPADAVETNGGANAARSETDPATRSADTDRREDSNQPVPPEDPATEPNDDGSEVPSDAAAEPAVGSASGHTDDGGALAEAMGAEPSPSAAATVDDGSGAETAGAAGDRTVESRTETGPDGAGEDAAVDRDRDAADDRSHDGTAADDRSHDGTDLDRTVVRITRDVGEILGVDEREYDLEREDVVTLPAANADPLLERDAAEQIE
ncbi:DNA replication complex subunit Gins51 [Halopenitus persicus]|uniref:DNA replication factor GINS n=1 Tax=Halopenitus persicus TaxID=1048396 RepID=A0A1H3DM73_9EURY|nr:hypothetical protein [Halopenitus persicus]SDX67612.1 DNA replication factor GINS [Halopenitus persicus]